MMSRRDEVMRQFKIDNAEGAQTTIRCPFCPGTYVIPHLNRPEQYVCHSMPMCSVFEGYADPIDFLIACRKKRGVHAPWDQEPS